MNINPFERSWWLAALLWAVLAPAIATAAVEPVGRVISVAGEATAFRADESARSLDRGDPVYEGDEIRTGRRGNVQVRFVDEGLVDLDPGTRFAIDRYRTGGQDSGGSVLMNFIRGALRTITGSIGGSGDTYRMNTPTATIGVRGTGYALQYCDAACVDRFGGAPGLHGRVDEGGIRVETAQGSGDFDAGAFFFVPQGGLPAPVLQPPKGILDQVHEPGSSGDDAGEVAEVVVAAVNDDQPDGSVGGDSTVEAVFEAGNRFSGSLLGGGVAAAGNADKMGIGMYSNAQLFGPKELAVNGKGELVDANFDNGLYGGGVNGIASVGMVKLEAGNLNEPGFNADLGVGWGRWTGAMTVDGVSGQRGNLAFTVTNNFTAPTRLGDLGGELNYALAGGPKAFTPNSGTTWKVDAIAFGVNFGAASGWVTLDRFQLTKSNDKAVALFDATNSTLSNQSLDTAANSLSFTMDHDNRLDMADLAGSFVGTNADGMVVVYHVDATEEDGISRTTVTGTSVLKQAP